MNKKGYSLNLQTIPHYGILLKRVASLYNKLIEIKKITAELLTKRCAL